MAIDKCVIGGIFLETKILIVEDEKEIADLVEVYLDSENYQIHKCYTAAEALAFIEREEVDLAILDIMLPGGSGLDICRKIREKYSYPVIMLTARDQEMDMITGLTVGADDYVTKPFRPLELVARVKAQLRRYKRYSPPASEAEDANIITYGALMINKDSHECRLHDKPLSLTPTEFSILQILCENQGMVVSAENLFHQVWENEYYTKNNNTVTVHIRHLREKMKDSADDPQYIKTVWGVGYKIG